jgi:hypothetical protein
MEYRLGDWNKIGTQFSHMFSGLGDVVLTEDSLSFTSIGPVVATGIALTKEGGLIASMPLHSIDSCFERVVFEENFESIRLVGPLFDYMYSIPSEILKLRDLT